MCKMTKKQPKLQNTLNRHIRLLICWEPFVLTVRGAAAGLGVALGGLAGPELVDCNGGKGALLKRQTLIYSENTQQTFCFH